MKKIILRNSPLTVMVDDEDFARLQKISWAVDKYGYAYGRFEGEHVLMHRFILWLFAGDKTQTDHCDHNRLNNQKENLRTCTSAQNAANRPKRKNGTNSHKGVSFSKHFNKWYARIIREGRVVFSGCYDFEFEAIEAYREAVIRIDGEFACF